MTSRFAFKTCEKDAARAQLGNAQSLPKRPVTCRVKRCCCRAKIYVSGKLGERYAVPVLTSQSCGALARCLSLWRPSDSELLHPHVIWKRAAKLHLIRKVSKHSDCCDRERRSFRKAYEEYPRWQALGRGRHWNGAPLGHTVATGQFFVIAFSGCGRFRIINDWHHSLLVFSLPHEFASVRYASWPEGALCTRRWR